MTPTNPFLSPAHLQKMMSAWHASPIEVQQVLPHPIDNSASILVTLTAQQSSQIIGHFGATVHYTLNGQAHQQRLVLKVKPHGRDIAGMLGGLASLSEPQLGEIYNQYADRTGFYNTHLRELAVYQHLPADLQPKIFGILALPEAESYQILMEDLSERELLNSVMEPEKWTDKHLKTALRALAQWHATASKHWQELDPQQFADTSSPNYLSALKPLWQVLLDQGSARFTAEYPPALVMHLQNAIDQIEGLEARWRNLPKTLIHNDANPRNSCFRADGSFCLYDWELACIDLPVYDAIELLSFVLHEGNSDQRLRYLHYYKAQLQEAWPVWQTNGLFEEAAYLAAVHFGLHRLGMYMMAHAVAPYPFLPRVMKQYAALLNDLVPFQSKSLQ